MRKIKSSKIAKRFRIKRRVRSQISGTAERPRLSVFRSNRNIYAQLVNDTTGTTIASASDVKVAKGTKVERAEKVGQEIAAAAKAQKISTVLFDRNGFKYAGRVKTLADSAREGGLEF